MIERWEWRIAVVLGALAIALHNWWVYIYPAGWMPHHSFHALISEAAAVDQPHGRLLSMLDVIVGIALLVAFGLRWRFWKRTSIVMWIYGVMWALGGLFEGIFPMECASTPDKACGKAELKFTLPVHHYLHIGLGILEFAGGSFMILKAWKTPAYGWLARLGRWLAVSLLVCYPLIGLTFFTKHWQGIMEPVFFVIFSIIGGAVLWYRTPSTPGTDTSG
jgi:hypothetical protein